MSCPKTGRFNRYLLGDDGTMDTVISCSECGEEFRSNPDAVTAEDRIAQAKEMAEQDHEDPTWM